MKYVIYARVKRINKELMSLQPPKTDESIKVNEEHMEAFLQALWYGTDPRSHLRELFKNSDIKRSIIKAFVYKIEIGGEPKYRADVYLRPHNEIICQTDRRGPYRRHRREGVVVVSSPINVIEELN